MANQSELDESCNCIGHYEETCDQDCMSNYVIDTPAIGTGTCELEGTSMPCEGDCEGTGCKAPSYVGSECGQCLSNGDHVCVWNEETGCNYRFDEHIGYDCGDAAFEIRGSHTVLSQP
eukprot:UN15735